jgi:hypothetical protein
MKLYEAKSIITDVFENPFNKETFSYFIRNLLKNMHPAEFLRTGYNIPKAFEDFIGSYERLGKYEDEESNQIDVLIVKLKRDHSIDYARSTQRNFVRWYLNDKGKDAALVAFHTEKSSEWRFSFIKMQYSLEKKADELTPAKRSSFMVGETGKSHTAQRQLVELLKNDHTPCLSDIEDAFSIEAVSDEFYEKYKALLFNLVDEIEKIVKTDKTVKDEFESKNITILNFSKKLLGQIVFLYFLQKKGWLGLEEKEKYGEGDKNFLRSLFNKTKPDENFFNDSLEYLFYDALSKKRVTDYYERFKTRIPFLNGGLFDPIEFYDWQKTDIVVPNKIFSDRKGDEEGSGILDVFDLYNFTVKEDEPLETEVAIDPEMLGKVFERMLDVTERKSKGAFYTPREIVHYMAQQSLLYFLETELNQTVSYSKIGSNQSELFGNEVKKGQLDIIDENKACAVPKADLEMFIHYGEHIIDKDIAIEEGKLKQNANKQQIPESIRQHADDIDKALENIKICDPAVGSGAFPVGIMNEIVKLRKLLTPFLKKENVKDRNAYRFKSNAIKNSIYGVDIDAGAVEIAKLRLWLSMVVDEERIDDIEPLPNLEYKIVRGNSLINIPDGTAINDALAKDIELLIKSYYHITDKEKKQEQKQIIDGKIQEQLKFVSEFAGHEIDFDFKLYFHEVWNGKKGFDVIIGNPPFVAKINQEDSAYFRKNYKTIQGKKYDLFRLFIEKGLDILNYNSVLTFIVPDVILNLKQASKLRKFIIDNYYIRFVAIAPLTTFKASVEPVIISFAKTKSNENSLLVDINNLKIINEVMQKDWAFGDYNFDFKINNPERIVLYRIFQKKKIIKDEMIWKKGLGVYSRQHLSNKFSKEEVDNIMENKPWTKDYKADETFGPEIIGKDVFRYKLVWNGKKWLSYGPWLAFQRPIEYFKGPRLVVREITSSGFYNVNAAYIEDEYFNNQSIFNGILKQNSEYHLKFFLALINSKLFSFYAIGSSPKSNRTLFPTILMETLEIFPVPDIDLKLQRKFVSIANYIIFLKLQNSETMSFYFEQLIDGMVYELYFENEIKQAGCDILKYLDDLPEITEDMEDDEKLKIITEVFNKLYDKESQVRKNLFFMDSVEEVAIIKNSLEK